MEINPFGHKVFKKIREWQKENNIPERRFSEEDEISFNKFVSNLDDEDISFLIDCGYLNATSLKITNEGKAIFARIHNYVS